MRRLLTLIIIILGFVSCEKALFEPDVATTDPLENFDYLWNEVDQKYSYFDLKGIDWNAVREHYRPQVSATTSEEELFKIMGDMLVELRDDHTNLITPFDVSRFNGYLNYPANYNERTIDLYYLPHRSATEAFDHGFLDDGNIAYLRYSSFSNTISKDGFDYILNKYANTKGMILDMRENGGGSLYNVFDILGRFTTSKVMIGYSKTRNGPGHNDFGPDEPFYIAPSTGVKYLKPVILLIDRGSYSATTFFALGTKAFPNITLMGDATGGGGGLPNGGQLPNGWTYRFSISQLLDLDKKNYAEQGVPPEIAVNFDWTDLTRDEIIDRAIQELQ